MWMWKNENPYVLIVQCKSGSVTVENRLIIPNSEHTAQQFHYWVYVQKN
jgi:hypothetical protein